jgi:hypothetical protein
MSARWTCRTVLYLIPRRKGAAFIIYERENSWFPILSGGRNSTDCPREKGKGSNELLYKIVKMCAACTHVLARIIYVAKNVRTCVNRAGADILCALHRNNSLLHRVLASAEQLVTEER